MAYQTTGGNSKDKDKDNNKKQQSGVDITTLTPNVQSQISSELTTDLTGKNGYEIMAAAWAVAPQLAAEIGNMNKLYASSHGLFASVPIICKGQDCPYKDVCMVSQNERVPGRRCPMEISAILARYEMWCQHFEIDISSGNIPSKDLVDATLIKDLVNLEIQQMRAENKIALNGDFMAKTLLDIDKKCTPYYGEVVSPASEFLLTLQQRKEKILNQLNATRKDKAADKRKSSPSEDAIRLFQQIREQQIVSLPSESISDVEFDENGNIIETETESDKNGDREESPGGSDS